MLEENIIKYKQKHKKRLALRAFVESAGGAKGKSFLAFLMLSHTARASRVFTPATFHHL